VARLRDGLERAGHRVGLFVPDTVHRGAGRVLDLWDPAARRRLRRRVASFEPDVVHFHNVVNELSTSVIGIGVPSVLTVHDARILGIRAGVDHGRSGLAPAVLARAAKNRLASARLRRGVRSTIAPGPDLAAALRAAGFPDVHHIPNFAPVRPESAPGDDIVFVGSVSAHKGVHVLLEAFARISADHPRVTLRIVGDGPLLPDLRQRATHSALPVVFAGRVSADDVHEHLRDAAVVVLPSLGVEGGGPTLAVVEAMASGRCVVVSDAPGIREGVDETVGAVVPAGDAPALAGVLHELLGDPVALRRRGAAARERAVARWSPAVAVQQVEQVYRAVGA
jgi:glycosyltransferase involved in cell wall biosynthesis